MSSCTLGFLRRFTSLLTLFAYCFSFIVLPLHASLPMVAPAPDELSARERYEPVGLRTPPRDDLMAELRYLGTQLKFADAPDLSRFDEAYRPAGWSDEVSFTLEFLHDKASTGFGMMSQYDYLNVEGAAFLQAMSRSFGWTCSYDEETQSLLFRYKPRGITGQMAFFLDREGVHITEMLKGGRATFTSHHEIHLESTDEVEVDTLSFAAPTVNNASKVKAKTLSVHAQEHTNQGTYDLHTATFLADRQLNEGNIEVEGPALIRGEYLHNGKDARFFVKGGLEVPDPLHVINYGHWHCSGTSHLHLHAFDNHYMFESQGSLRVSVLNGITNHKDAIMRFAGSPEIRTPVWRNQGRILSTIDLHVIGRLDNQKEGVFQAHRLIADDLTNQELSHHNEGNIQAHVLALRGGLHNTGTLEADKRMGLTGLGTSDHVRIMTNRGTIKSPRINLKGILHNQGTGKVSTHQLALLRDRNAHSAILDNEGHVEVENLQADDPLTRVLHRAGRMHIKTHNLAKSQWDIRAPIHMDRVSTSLDEFDTEPWQHFDKDTVVTLSLPRTLRLTRDLDAKAFGGVLVLHTEADWQHPLLARPALAGGGEPEVWEILADIKSGGGLYIFTPLSRFLLGDEDAHTYPRLEAWGKPLLMEVFGLNQQSGAIFANWGGRIHGVERLKFGQAHGATSTHRLWWDRSAGFPIDNPSFSNGKVLNPIFDGRFKSGGPHARPPQGPGCVKPQTGMTHFLRIGDVLTKIHVNGPMEVISDTDRIDFVFIKAQFGPFDFQAPAGVGILSSDFFSQGGGRIRGTGLWIQPDDRYVGQWDQYYSRKVPTPLKSFIAEIEGASGGSYGARFRKTLIKDFSRVTINGPCTLDILGDLNLLYSQLYVSGRLGRGDGQVFTRIVEEHFKEITRASGPGCNGSYNTFDFTCKDYLAQKSSSTGSDLPALFHSYDGSITHTPHTRVGHQQLWMGSRSSDFLSVLGQVNAVVDMALHMGADVRGLISRIGPDGRFRYAPEYPLPLFEPLRTPPYIYKGKIYRGLPQGLWDGFAPELVAQRLPLVLMDNLAGKGYLRPRQSCEQGYNYLSHTWHQLYDLLAARHPHLIGDPDHVDETGEATASVIALPEKRTLTLWGADPIAQAIQADPQMRDLFLNNASMVQIFNPQTQQFEPKLYTAPHIHAPAHWQRPATNRWSGDEALELYPLGDRAGTQASLEGVVSVGGRVAFESGQLGLLAHRGVQRIHYSDGETLYEGVRIRPTPNFVASTNGEITTVSDLLNLEATEFESLGGNIHLSAQEYLLGLAVYDEDHMSARTSSQSGLFGTSRRTAMMQSSALRARMLRFDSDRGQGIVTLAFPRGRLEAPAINARRTRLGLPGGEIDWTGVYDTYTQASSFSRSSLYRVSMGHEREHHRLARFSQVRGEVAILAARLNVDVPGILALPAPDDEEGRARILEAAGFQGAVHFVDDEAEVRTNPLRDIHEHESYHHSEMGALPRFILEKVVDLLMNAVLPGSSAMNMPARIGYEATRAVAREVVVSTVATGEVNPRALGVAAANAVINTALPGTEPGKNATFVETLRHYGREEFLRAPLYAGVNATIGGQEAGSAFTQAFRNAGILALAKTMAFQIGELYADKQEEIPGTPGSAQSARDGDPSASAASSRKTSTPRERISTLEHQILHTGAAMISGALLRPDDPLYGAGSAALNTLMAHAFAGMGQESKAMGRQIRADNPTYMEDQIIQEVDTRLRRDMLFAELGAGIMTSLVGADLVTGSQVAHIALEYNSYIHKRQEVLQAALGLRPQARTSRTPAQEELEQEIERQQLKEQAREIQNQLALLCEAPAADEVSYDALDAIPLIAPGALPRLNEVYINKVLEIVKRTKEANPQEDTKALDWRRDTARKALRLGYEYRDTIEASQKGLQRALEIGRLVLYARSCAQGAMMGFASGSIFPGAGNATGASIGCLVNMSLTFAAEQAIHHAVDPVMAEGIHTGAQALVEFAHPDARLALSRQDLEFSAQRLLGTGLAVLAVGRLRGSFINQSLHTTRILTPQGMQWGGGIHLQGMPFENYVASLFTGVDRLPASFKTFDFYLESTRTAISVKTLNTQTMSRMLKPERIFHSLKKNIDAIVNFERYDLRGVFLRKDMIGSQELYVGIPKTTTHIQRQQIARANEYARANGVQLKIFEMK